MDFIYKKEVKKEETSFQRIEQIHLAGCNVGIIPRFMKNILTPSAGEPFSWTIEANMIIETLKLPGNVIIIDAKPNSKKEVLLWELVRVHGYSSSGWTPAMLALKEVLIDEDPDIWDKNKFTLKSLQPEHLVYTHIYMRGSIKGGELTGTWTLPPPNSTNGPFLWPEAFEYFAKCAGYKENQRRGY